MRTHKTIKTQKDAVKAGFTIDRHCYPHVAYKGARFAPDEWFTVPTDREEELEEALVEAGRFFIWRVHGPYGPSPMRDGELDALLDKVLRIKS